MDSDFPETEPPRPPPVLGNRYEILEPIGRGGMASIYRSRDQRTNEVVAVKIPDPRVLADDRNRARFQGEVRALRALDHPHVVRVFDDGEDQGFAYIVMELCEGGSLGAWVEANGPMPRRLAVGMIAAAADGLHEAHGLGIVHRDIKPGNLLLTVDGRLKVADFGIAHFEGGETSVTQSGIGLGTLGFVAPEQREDGGSATPRSDVYALGATLHTLLTTRVELDLFAWELRPEIMEGIPEVLVPILARAVVFEPAARTPTALRLAEELRSILGRLPKDEPHPPLVMPLKNAGVPAAPPRASRPSLAPGPFGIPRRRTLLVVEEDPRLARWMRQIIESDGAAALLASDPVEARTIIHDHPGFLDGAVIDVVVGSEGVVDEIKRQRPNLPILYTSSLTAEPAAMGVTGTVLRKPCTAEELLDAVRSVVGE